MAKFPRADVRERHVKRYHTISGPPHQTSKQTRDVMPERSRQACDRCRQSKLKCDDHHPCQACRVKGLTCTTSKARRGPGRPRNSGRNHVAGIDHTVQSSSSAVREVGSLPVSPNVIMHSGNIASSRSTLWTADGDTLAATGTGVAARGIEALDTAFPNPFPAYAFPSPDASFPGSAGLPPEDLDSFALTENDFDIMDSVWDLPLLVSLLPWCPGLES
jgi:hypothetical protein